MYDRYCIQKCYISCKRYAPDETIRYISSHLLKQHLGSQQYITIPIFDLKDKIYFLYILLTPAAHHTPKSISLSPPPKTKKNSVCRNTSGQYSWLMFL